MIWVLFFFRRFRLSAGLSSSCGLASTFSVGVSEF